jgi:transcriptional regulator GlxA family with amidase domain
LQDLFKKYLNRTPMEELSRCRAERLAGLLARTNMTIGEIAAASGFEAGAHVARFFSRQIGITPLAYRKKCRVP